MSWTDAAIIDLTRMWREGRSARDIGTALGVTKNAIIGKAHRIDLPARKEGASARNGREGGKVRERMEYVYRGKQRNRRVSNPQAPKLKAEKIPPTPIDDKLIPMEQRKSLLELGPLDCRWPVHDVGHPEFFFCGSAIEPEMPYCPAHCRVAFVHASSRWRPWR